MRRPPDGGFAPEYVNVIDQRHDPDSLYHFIQKLIERYRTSSEIGWGAVEVLEHENPAVLAHSVASDTGRMFAVHNFAPEATRVSLVVAGEPEGTSLSDLLERGSTPLGARGRVDLDLEPYGSRWLRVLRPGDGRLT